MKMFEICRPARLKVFDGEVQVMVCAAISGEREASGVCWKPGRTNSSWISSETISTLCLRQIEAMRSSSSRVQTRPAGLCGLQSRKSLTLFLMIFSSKSAKSIS